MARASSLRPARCETLYAHGPIEHLQEREDLLLVLQLFFHKCDFRLPRNQSERISHPPPSPALVVVPLVSSGAPLSRGSACSLSPQRLTMLVERGEEGLDGGPRRSSCTLSVLHERQARLTVGHAPAPAAPQPLHAGLTRRAHLVGSVENELVVSLGDYGLLLRGFACSPISLARAQLHPPTRGKSLSICFISSPCSGPAMFLSRRELAGALTIMEEDADGDLKLAPSELAHLPHARQLPGAFAGRRREREQCRRLAWGC
eukprot:767498-Hanusia_phi.AAC.2